MAINFVFPVDSTYTITSPFGMRKSPDPGATKNHVGIDIGVPIGTNVLATLDGKVIQNGYSSARGNYIELTHVNGFTSIYQHLQSSVYKIGDTVKQGQTIGKSGNTGISTGPHLHFEVRQNGKTVNPTMLNMKSSGGQKLQESPSNQLHSNDTVLSFIKDKWWLIAGGLVLVAILK